MMKFFRRFGDLGISGFMARWYDGNTRRQRMGEMHAYAAEVASHIGAGTAVLEVAPGPGYLAIELARTGNYKITGLDISRDFVEIARRNAHAAGVAVDFCQGNAAAMPFPNGSFDFIVCTAAFKNFKEPLGALNEMYRVLKPGGTALIIDMKAEATDREIDTMVKEGGAKGLEAVFLKLTFKYFLKKGAYTRQGFISLISQTSYRDYEIKEVGVGYHVYLRK